MILSTPRVLLYGMLMLVLAWSPVGARDPSHQHIRLAARDKPTQSSPVKTERNSGVKNVAVVGAGIGGATAAYTLATRLGTDVNITVLEATGRIGGRLKHITLEGVAIDVGGDVFSEVNPTMVEITKELNISLDNSSYSGNGLTGVYDGQTWWTLDQNILQEAAVGVMLYAFKSHLKDNYKVRANGANPYTSVNDYVKAGGLDRYTSETYKSLLTNSHISAEFQFRNLQGLTRSIYDQTEALNAFAGVASLLSATTNTWSATGGNDVMVQDILSASKAHVVLNYTVSSISPLSLSGVEQEGYVVNGKDTFDAVIIATPLEFTDVTFPNISVPAFSPRTYHHWYVTIVTASGLSSAYFGVKTVPDTILTPGNATTPFAVLALQDKLPSGLLVYKLFSNKDITPLLEQIFTNLNQSYVQYWPFTFPNLSPPSSSSSSSNSSSSSSSGYQPVVLAPNLLYTAGMESVAVAMECAAVAGKNAAYLLTNEWKERK